MLGAAVWVRLVDVVQPEPTDPTAILTTVAV
jgi:hypothetical protein